MRLPLTLRHLAETLTRLPSIGPRQAIRLALHLSSLPREDQELFAQALTQLTAIGRCRLCDFPYETSGDLCEICADPKRSSKVLMIVEKETDLLSMEKIGRYAGRYLITGVLPRVGVLTPRQKERLVHRAELEKRQGGLEELILAVSATTHGEALARAVSDVFSVATKKTTRLGRGLPRGGEVEFADEDTLGYSLDNRV